ncbi:MAG: aminotransferase class IV [Flavobacteriaceae bacterium]|nr:aminotransferase class IV [Flavobacteriaceae bacterium]MCY4216160.1 aminotransferase class IV [Flavobacteriaceae bacterium]MCY4254147.1 aminotransferase class IV [Flavobacteriaceae bacterium]
MWNHNGQLKSENSPREFGLIHGLLEGVVYAETVRIKEDSIFFWDHHYFNLMAFLRLARVEIPENYSMEYFKSEVIKTRKLVSNSEHVLIHIYLLIQPNKIDCLDSIEFFMVPKKSNALNKKISTASHRTDIFDEIRIISNRLSNQTAINQLVFKVSKSFARENNLDSVLLVNESRNLVESNHGSLFLLQSKNNLFYTPTLESGCRNLAIRSNFIDYIEKSTEFKIISESISAHELKKSDELMVLSIEKGLTCITLYRGSDYQTSVSQTLFKQYCSNRNLI